MSYLKDTCRVYKELGNTNTQSFKDFQNFGMKNFSEKNLVLCCKKSKKVSHVRKQPTPPNIIYVVVHSNERGSDPLTHPLTLGIRVRKV